MNSGERKVDGRSLARLPLRPNASAVAVNDSLDDRQAKSGSLKLSDGVKPLKDTKQLVRIPHVEADTVVFNTKDILIVLRCAACLNRRRLPAARKLQRIREQIDEDLPEQNFIADCRRQFRELHL